MKNKEMDLTASAYASFVKSHDVAVRATPRGRKRRLHTEARRAESNAVMRRPTRLSNSKRTQENRSGESRSYTRAGKRFHVCAYHTMAVTRARTGGVPNTRTHTREEEEEGECSAHESGQRRVWETVMPTMRVRHKPSKMVRGKKE